MHSTDIQIQMQPEHQKSTMPNILPACHSDFSGENKAVAKAEKVISCLGDPKVSLYCDSVRP